MARQRLGQYFLPSDEFQQKIVRALAFQKNDVVIEVGAGHGELTEKLCAVKGALKIFAVEKDPVLAHALQEKFRNEPQVEIIEGDIRQILAPLTKKLKAIEAKSYKLVGNLPYYLTGYLLRLVGELEPKPEVCVFMVQAEVAERLIAQKPHFNRLAAITSFWAEAALVARVPKKFFHPEPKVDSAIITLVSRIKNQVSRTLADDYYRMAKILFAQPRQTIVNNLLRGLPKHLTTTGTPVIAQSVHNRSNGGDKGIKVRAGTLRREEILEALARANLEPNLRPQNLSREDILRLTELLFHSF